MTDDEAPTPPAPPDDRGETATGSAGPAAPPAASPLGTETELRTFLIADIRGYTSFTEEHGDEAAATLAGRFAALVREVVEGRGGFLLELRGDEALAVFTSARQALKAANEIQRRQEIDALPRGIGIGLDAGEAIPIEGGFRGSALNLAARLCAQAGPGQVVASEAVIHLAARVDGLAYIDARTMRLKGLDEPVRAVTVVPESQAPKRRRGAASAQRLERRGLLALGGLGLAAVAVMVVLVGSNLLTGRATTTPEPSSAVEPSPSPPPQPSLVANAGAIGTEDLPVVAFLDGTDGAVMDQLSGFGGPVEVIYAEGAFWILDEAPRAIHRVNPSTRDDEVQISLGFDVGVFAVGGGRVWISEAIAPRVHVFDAVSAREIDTFEMPRNPFFDAIQGLAWGAGDLWVSHGPNDISQVDPVSFEIRTSIASEALDHLRFADDLLWVVDGQGAVIKIDPARRTEDGRTSDLGRVSDLEVGGGYAWAAQPGSGTVVRIDGGMDTTTFPAQVSVQSLSFDASSGLLWTANYASGSVSRIDPVTGQSTAFTVGHGVQVVGAGDGSVIAGVTKGPAEVVASLEGSVLRVGTQEDFYATDPAVFGRSPDRYQLDQATCARLLDYPDADGVAGAVLQPSVAAAMPEVSADGRAYTFTISSGFVFSPPSSQPLTAETYRSSIERAMDPALGGDAPGYDVLDDIRGASEFHGGQTDHVEGISVDGDRLTIQLVQPSATFLQRLWLPTFCPVPIGTPAVEGGINDPPIARAGPYYIGDRINGVLTVLRRNPNYPGPRSPTFDAVAYLFEPDLGRAVGLVESGQLDVAAGIGAALDVGGRLDAAWGPASEAAASGDQRLFRGPRTGLDFLTFNPGSETLAEPDIRRAVALALDRPSLANAVHWAPTDEMSPLTMPGLTETDRFPLDGPRTEEAKGLLGDREVSLKIAWYLTRGCPQCRQAIDIIVKDLADVGITATFDEVEVPGGWAAGIDSGYDIAVGNAWQDEPDLATWLDLAFGGTTQYDLGAPSGWLPADARTELDRILGLTGTERETAAAALAKRLADDIVFLPIFQPVHSQFVSERIGCLTFQQPYPYLDLVAACLD